MSIAVFEVLVTCYRERIIIKERLLLNPAKSNSTVLPPISCPCESSMVTHGFHLSVYVFVQPTAESHMFHDPVSKTIDPPFLCARTRRLSRSSENHSVGTNSTFPAPIYECNSRHSPLDRSPRPIAFIVLDGTKNHAAGYLSR
ncbi:uncharacterized protein LOC112456269 [Temnothorax curvispinosus]|uniref:Uncharacterized protein LOC112456269 n=1 Tax=Temnothorax curvispinosus TaxID=300111 RepID=A0A6J1Q0F9_9HYME|nr:uncharacterized protein LOC112456269 [Temnothorax curvispinosus]